AAGCLERDEEAGEIDPSEKQTERRHQDVVHERIHDRGEGGTDDHADGKVHNAAARNEFPEFLEHRYLPPCRGPTIARLAPDSQTAVGRLKAQSTIYRNRLASDVRGVWTEQECDQRRHLFGTAEPPEWHPQPRALSPFIVQRRMGAP